jgi:hypothetical protein
MFHFVAGSKKPGYADGGVASEPVSFITRAAPFFLKQIVDQPSGVSEVFAKISDARPHRFHDNKPIDTARRLDDIVMSALLKPHMTRLNGSMGSGTDLGRTIFPAAGELVTATTDGCPLATNELHTTKAISAKTRRRRWN